MPDSLGKVSAIKAARAGFSDILRLSALRSDPDLQGSELSRAISRLARRLFVDLLSRAGQERVLREGVGGASVRFASRCGRLQSIRPRHCVACSSATQ
eukprot:6007194-Lingulodinium_polyedra.AAC.1